MSPLVSVIDNGEILILGGLQNKRSLGDGFIFDVATKSLRKVVKDDSLLKFSSRSNQCVMTRKGQVVGLVEDQQFHLHLINYEKG